MNDIIFLAAGAVGATILAVVIYTQRERIMALRSTVANSASATRQQLTRGAEATYRDAVVQMANAMHLAGHLVPLEQIAVVPGFYALNDPFDPLDEENPEYDRPHNLLPKAPDWPQALASFYLPGIPLNQLLRGTPHIALLGMPGSGRTVALATIALLVARQTQDEQPGSLLREKRLPIYFHLDDVNLDPEFYGVGADPLFPMVEAARIRLRGLATRLMGAVQSEFAEGGGLILADGWDEISPEKRCKVTEWLRVVLETYPGNRLVVAGGLHGYGQLQSLDLRPIYMMPWGASEYAQIGQLWAAAWPTIGGTTREPAPAPSEDLVRRAVRGNRARTPLDATLRVWATFAGDDAGQGQRGWFQAYLNRVLPAPDLAIVLERMGEIILGQTGDPGLTFDQVSGLVDATAETRGGRASMSTPDLVFALTNQTHLLAERANGRLVFAQPLMGAYMAARAIKDGPFRETLLDGRPLSDMTLAFLAQMQDITPYVEHRMAQPTDILRDSQLSLVAWAADADLKAGWRAKVFTHLTRLLIGAVEYPAARERIAAALVASRDPNVMFIFREGLKHENPRVRMLSAFGMGALSDPEVVIQLGEILEDEDATVQTAAAMALGAIGTKTALNYMIQVMLTGNDMARRAVAEILAAANTAGEGHDIIKEAAAETDPATRRAAVYGLERIGEPWAFDMIADMERRDDQWMVRAAAAAIMDQRREGKHGDRSPRPLPHTEEINWLVKWLGERNESASPGPQGISQLGRALREGDDATRLAAAEMLGALGATDAIKSLYAALRDAHPEIRDGAYRALCALSRSSGYPLPGVV